jgi:hypothetical protein
MKKLVAISVLFVGLAAAVFAQDDEGKWKIGFMARYVTDMLFFTDMSGKSKNEVTSSTGTTTRENVFGEFNKGTIRFFGDTTELQHEPLRMLLSLSTSGENYQAYADIKFDGWTSWDSIWNFLQNSSDLWYLKGNAGIFNGQVGNDNYNGWVSTQATWNDWLGWNQLCRFGVWNADGFLASNEFRTWNEWGSVAALGATFADNYRFSLGYKFSDGAPETVPTEPAGSRSAINGSFMLNARLSDAIALDLFYAVRGKDTNTFARSESLTITTGTDVTASDYTLPEGKWQNIIGLYAGLNFVENLGLSIGYTANFEAYEAGAYHDPANTDVNPVKTTPITFTSPFYSGIDIRLNFSGIDKIGLTFNNNISLASVKGEEIKKDGKTEKIILDFGSEILDKGYSKDWFHWDAELKASFSFIENLGLTLHLGNRLAVLSDAVDTTIDTNVGGTGIIIPIITKGTTKSTDNEFRVSLFADYGIGAVNVGIGLFLGLQSKAYESELTTTAVGVSSTTKHTASSDVVTFGIPIMFKVQF